MKDLLRLLSPGGGKKKKKILAVAVYVTAKTIVYTLAELNDPFRYVARGQRRIAVGNWSISQQ